MSKRPKTFQPVVATANDLASGAVVFRDRDGAWSRDIADAEVAATPDEAEALFARARADQDARHLVVDVAAIEVVRDGAFVRPAALRELIRTSGPTIVLPADAPQSGAPAACRNPGA
ncbi:hypothetical protein CCR97_10295 [Rhodoplanes elegans]|uniref:Nitrite reductase n=1 Tax=Rhodoplanes elegans TaxID=29408 RepID=A0A327KVR2_9BRAD|nr:DUF2849 domain-containing protein [Rhodoplanes elegans]MBK5958596.1 hypothetical protein [Rhodoplanes elegans]RAI41615.1 hypothetical protein CH338_02510 [Rhodoplanes elegans]